MAGTTVTGSGVEGLLATNDSGVTTAALVNALNAVLNTSELANIITSPTDSPIDGENNIYNLTPSGAGWSFTVPGGAEGVILDGTVGGTLYGDGGTEVINGDAAADTINITGGNATVIVDVKNLINLGGGVNAEVDSSDGKDTVSLTGANLLLNPQSTNAEALHLASGANTVTLGTASVSFQASITGGTDSLALGSGAYTATMSDGAATITGSSGTLNFNASTDTDAASSVSISLGSGSATLVAGAGAATFTGGTGAVTMTGGSGTAVMTGSSSTTLFNAGAGNDTMIGSTVSGAKGEEFAFTSTYSGSYVVENFNSSDTISVAGVTSTTLLADATYSSASGNTTIKVGSATITLVGYDLTSANHII